MCLGEVLRAGYYDYDVHGGITLCDVSPQHVLQ